MSDSKKIPGAEEIMENDLKYPQRAAESSASFEGVYAGPARIQEPQGMVYAGPRPQMPIAMATYAGPQFMNNGMFMGSFPPAPMQPADPDKVLCDICGGLNTKGSNFCSECGARLSAKPTEPADNTETP